MVAKIRLKALLAFPAAITACLVMVFAWVPSAAAITAFPVPTPIPGSYGLGAVKLKPPPTVGATISTPGNGASFTTTPITVNGICPNDLLVQLYDNGVLVGSVMCANGSFSLQVGLFAGTNELKAIVYDELDQAGPTSNTMTVTYTDTYFTSFGTSITFTSSYGRRAAPAGSELSWPFQLSGGTGPYAFSIDAGDGSAPQLKSQGLAGVVTLSHTYKKAGIYPMNIKVTDVNGVSAFLQVTAVASGQVDDTAKSTKDKNPGDLAAAQAAAAAANRALLIQAIVSIVLLPPTFWLGRHSQTVSIRNRMLRERDDYKQD